MSEERSREALPPGTRLFVEMLAEMMNAGAGRTQLEFELVDGRVRRWYVKKIDKGGALDLDRFDKPAQ